MPNLPSFIHTDVETRAAYSEGAGIYRIVPTGVALPRGLDDVVELVQWAAATGASLVPRGAGSGMGGGNVGPGIVVDFTVGFETCVVSESRVRTGAGTTYSALARAAAVTGLRLPPEPSSSRFCTLGGMVACDAAGPRSLRFGSVRGWTEGIQVVWADGRSGWVRRGHVDGWEVERPLRDLTIRNAGLIRDRAPRVRKNASGYALAAYLDTGELLDVLIGSEGTLGLITQVEVRLDPTPSHRASVLIGLDSLDRLSPVVTELADRQPSCVELLDRTFLDIARPRARLPVPTHVAAALIVEFERQSESAARGAVGDAARIADRHQAYVLTGIGAPDEREIWSLRHAASPILAALPESRRSLQVVEDGCVPVASLGRYVSGLRRAAERRGVDVVIFGHAGDGHVHVNALVDLTDAHWMSRVRALMADVVDLLAQLGGTLSGEHGDGRLRAPSLAAVYGEPLVSVFRAVKALFDPGNLLNPGVIVADTTDPLQHLKVGESAAEIPASVASALRKMEREGGWATPKHTLTHRS